MKTKLKMKLYATVVVFSLCANFSYAQWNWAPTPSGNRWGQTNNPFALQNKIKSIVIGNFTDYSAIPQAALHVNSNFLTQTTGTYYYSRGEVFRTVGPNTQLNAWRMFTGAGQGTEKAALFVPANSKDFVIQSSTIGSNIRFNVGNNQQRVIITDGHGQQGHLGIGNNFSNPKHMLHIHTTPNIAGNPPPPAYAAFTNTNTGATATDGFLVGINEDGVAQLIQQENLPMQFLVNGSTTSTPLTRERMRITAGPQTINGEPEDNITRVGIWRTGATGNPNPLSLLQIGEPATPSLAGHRDWMDVGTYSNVRELNTYVGILSIKDSNRFDAIIDWGSPATTTASPPRSMRFIYTTSQTGTLLSADYQGLEASRWWSNGDEVRIGFGGNPVTNLYYNDSEDPTQTVEINSGAPDFSGLRFTDLREHSLHVPLNPDQGVLSVNEDGDVIYVDAAGGGGVDNDWFVAGTVSPNANIGDNIYTQGFTGLGDFSTIIPQSLLHLYQPDIALYAQFTNDNTGNTVADGFLAGINEDGVAQLNQQEDADMNFYTSNKLCLTITNKGKIKVNSFSSDKPHLLIADKDGTLMLCKLKKKEQKLPNLKHV